MYQIYRSMCATVHEPLYKPIHLDVDIEALTARVRVPGLLETTLEPIRNKVTGALHRARIDLPFGKEFATAEVASGTTRATGRILLDFAHTHAHLVRNRLTSRGVAR
jgi:hypothetical protein